MKQLMTLLLAACAFTLTSCDDTQQAPETPIQVGAENDNSIEVSPQATRILLLSGGTGKYSAYVADSKIASVSMSRLCVRISKCSRLSLYLWGDRMTRFGCRRQNLIT